jgi:opacity protein-like surface antigen
MIEIMVRAIGAPCDERELYMRHSLTLTVALLGTGPALAAGFDQPIASPAPAAPVIAAPAPVVSTDDWSGAYAGGQLGFGRLSTDVADGAGGPQNGGEVYEGEGAFFGVHAGYMFDFGRFVAGGELDFDSSHMSVSILEAPGADEIGEIDSIFRAKLRLGFDAGRVLPYVTAGLARASAGFDEKIGDNGIVSGRDDTFEGHFVGVGASFALSERLVIGVEALRHDFSGTGSFAGEAFADDDGFDTVVDTVSLRGSFRF